MYEEISVEYDKLRKKYSNLISENKKLEDEYKNLNIKLIELQLKYSNLLTDYEEIGNLNKKLNDTIEILGKEKETYKIELEDLKKIHDNQTLVLKNLHSKYNEIEEERDTFMNKCADLADKIQTLEEEKEKLDEENQKKEREIKILTNERNDLGKKLQAISLILSKEEKQDNSPEKLINLLEKDFVELINKIPYKEEAKTIIKLKSIIERIEFVLSFKDKFSKNIVAICGGFSTGKSSFINSVFFSNDNSNFQLSTNITPTTAIPTYVVHGDSLNIKAASINNTLKEIKPEYTSMFDHYNIKDFGFHMRTLVQFLIVSNPFKDYKNICFIDTPGYNPGGSISVEDHEITLKYIDEANVILWLIGIDVNGTIPKSDIDFLRGINSSNKKIYIALNKADTRSLPDIEKIGEAVKNELEKNGIKVEGISAFSSINNQELWYHGKSLFQFLKEEDRPSDLKDSLREELKSIFRDYETFLKSDIKEAESFLSSFKSMELDIFQVGKDEKLAKSTSFYDRLDSLKTKFQSKIAENKKNLADLKNLEEIVLKEFDNLFFKEKRLSLKKI
ncbi:dynamin family protein [Calditerrivibrio nitroreducens]|nr:dynamin family protein [Calditerrivibrio nitroreducens]